MPDPRIGVVGLGAIGQTHIRTWTALGHTPVAVADNSPTARATAKVGNTWSVFDSGADLLRDADIDIVSICTPPAFHRDLAIAALRAGKTVLCEKPLAHTVADAREIADVAANAAGQLHVGFCHRFEPAIVAMKEQIEHGVIGTPITLRNRFAGVMASPENTWFSNPSISGGGALADTTIHSIDLFRYLLGEPVAVRSLHSTQASNLGAALQVEDSGVLILRNAAGALGVLESSWRTPPGEWTVTVYGTEGELSFDYATDIARHLSAGGAVVSETISGDRFALEFAHVIRCWRGEDVPRATVIDGLRANEILADAYANGIGS